MKPVGVLGAAAVLLLGEPDFGAATVLFATGLGVLFLAGARIAPPARAGRRSASVALAVLAVTSPYRLRRLTALPRSLGRSVRQRLPAHAVADRDRPRRVVRRRPRRERAEALLPARGAHRLRVRGAGRGVRLRRRRRSSSRCSRCSWAARSLISREAAQAGLTFQSYLAAAIGIWLGLQAFVNIGVNMGLLPTKGLTLPLLSYGGSSMLVTLGWLGVLLRIHHETQATGRVPRRAARGASRMTRQVGNDHGGRHGRTRVPGARAGARAARRGYDIVWLGTQRGIEARLVPAAGIPVEWLSVSGLRGKGVATLLAAPFRLLVAHLPGAARDAPAPARRRARRGRLRLGPGRHRGVAARAGRWSCTSRTPSRASPIACSRASPSACSRAFPAASAAACRPSASAIRCARRSSPCAPPERRYAGREGPRAPAGVRRQPGRCAPERRGAGGASASCPAALRPGGAAPDRQAQLRRDRAGVSLARHRGRRARLHRRHGERLRLGRPRRVPLRRADGRRTRGGRRAGRPRAVPGGRRRPPDAQRAVRRAAPAPRCCCPKAT